jgi:AcrR family transcriptional regulator
MSDETRTRLLEAAERILIEEGVHALTVRRVGAVSGLNGTLITYHFGTVPGLLSELCRVNLDPMLKDWEGLNSKAMKNSSLKTILEAWLGPLIRPSAFVKGGKSVIVFDEIASHGDPALSGQLLEAMLAVSRNVQKALKPHLPHLDSQELRARVRFISAACLGPPPRVRLSEQTATMQPMDGLGYLLSFAEGALLGAAQPRSIKKRPPKA